MTLSKEQIDTLLRMVAFAETDDGDCDSCFDHLAEFAELQLLGKEVPEVLQAIENHIQQCACCREEYEALVAGLQALEGLS